MQYAMVYPNAGYFVDEMVNGERPKNVATNDQRRLASGSIQKIVRAVFV